MRLNHIILYHRIIIHHTKEGAACNPRARGVPRRSCANLEHLELPMPTQHSSVRGTMVFGVSFRVVGAVGVEVVVVVLVV